MRVSKDKQKEYISRIRRLLAIDPDMTILKVAAKLEIDKDYAHKLINKVRKERVTRYEHYTIHKIVADFEDKMSASDKFLMDIIQNSRALHKDKVAALRELRNNNKELYEMFFNAGIFEKQLGKIKVEDVITEDHKRIIDKLFKYGVISDEEGDRGGNVGEDK